jgi:hypothetical protein
MLIFYSHVQAGKHFKCDPRTTKNTMLNVKYIINKSSEYNPNSIFRICKNVKTNTLLLKEDMVSVLIAREERNKRNF